MATCKFCGRPVLAGRVVHTQCWEETIKKIANEFCDEYCRFPRECKHEEDLAEHCDNCQMISLANVGV